LVNFILVSVTLARAAWKRFGLAHLPWQKKFAVLSIPRWALFQFNLIQPVINGFQNGVELRKCHEPTQEAVDWTGLGL